jgi:phosphoribosylformylglycinamidine cyclo-ligase
MKPKSDGQFTYKDAGVDIEAGERAVQRIKKLVETTFTRNVLQHIGHFGAFFELPAVSYRQPVLVSSIDGVGTKLKVAVMMNRHDTVGEDLVNHCVNDILTSGAKPLFFLDYLALGKVRPEVVEEIVRGMVRGCHQAGCALIGGETAEMTDLYQPGEYDLAGAIVGIVEKEQIVNGSSIQPGDVLVGLPSSGLHTNGYTLARKVFFERHSFAVDSEFPELERPLGEELLRIHRNYFPLVFPLLSEFEIKGMAHVTGGGIWGNLRRILPTGLTAQIDWNAWERPPIFQLIQNLGKVPEADMRRTFNLGIGYILVVPKTQQTGVVSRLKEKGEEPVVIGEIVKESEKH